ncbi:hypothetical protein [Persephonella sp.]
MFINWNWDMIRKKRKDSFEKLKNFFIFDIETVKDISMFEETADEKEIKRELDGEFLPIPFHRIVCVGTMIIKDKEILSFETLSTENEKEALKFFWNSYKRSFNLVKEIDPNDGKLKKHISAFPVLISVNGKSFDIPTILVRTLKYIPELDEDLRKFVSIHLDRFDAWEKEFPKYSHRYTKFHIDIPEDIFGRKISLKKLCYLCGIPVKQEGDGKEVQEMFLNGNLKKIGDYCSEDVLATAKLFSYINQHLLYGTYFFPEVDIFDNIEPVVYLNSLC